MQTVKRRQLLSVLSLRIFEQNGRIGTEDMPELFKKDCRRKRDYLEQLNRSFTRASMNLSWKNRFLESRDVVISQFRELAVILEEFPGRSMKQKYYRGMIKEQLKSISQVSYPGGQYAFAGI